MWNHLRSGVVGGIVAGAVILAGSAVAGSGVGGVFNLGDSNTVDARSVLSGTTAGKELVVANFGTDPASSALLGYARGASPAATLQNAGAGPALSLVAATGQPPFTTNSAYKVSNLNADRLDGLDAASFSRGVGFQNFAERVVVPESTGPEPLLLSVPGFGTLTVRCQSAAGGGVKLIDHNTTTQPVDFWIDNATDVTSQFGFRPGVVDPGGAFIAESSPVGFPTRAYGSTVSLGYGAPPGPRSMALIHLFAEKATDGGSCSAQAMATVWKSA
ncbi:MAG: hypothetical protein QOE36_3463 [Gaiellaceae bacterium]|nr:hypothetical protein [Gaiellaceae bacterium]